MSKGAISVILPQNYEMSHLQNQVENRPENSLIINEGYFPDIDITDYRNQARLDGTVTETRLKDALIEAIASVNDELKDFKTASKMTALDEIDCPYIDNQSVLVYRYKRAVYCLATANLYERYAAYDTTADGEKKMEILQESINQLRRDARFAIADIQKQQRVNVELL